MKLAVVLAAGLGSRLKEITINKPKGFIEIEGISLIKRSVENLRSFGIKNIIIGTGYLSEFYDDFAKNEGIKTVKNVNYANTSSMETLYILKNYIKEDFLLLESDLLYERDALKHLIFNKKDDVILASNLTNSGDEVFIEIDDSFNLINVSKNRNLLKNICCELVGISKISYNRYKNLCRIYEKMNNKKIDYEYILVESSKKRGIFVKKVEDLLWCEIDDKNHLKKAKEEIFPKIKEKSLFIKKNILLNPGPATTTDSVKLAQVVPDICPREAEFGEIMEYCSNEITKFVANTDEYTTIFFGGSGTGAIEAVITSSIPYNKKMLIVNNGPYGKRMCEIADVFNVNYIEFISSPIEPINLDKLENIIKKNNDISHLAVVHNETTTGLLTNLDKIGELSKKFRLELIVDAMSSFGAVPIDMKKQNISYLISSSNKNIQGMAGIGIVVAKKKSLIKTKKIKRSFYFNLYTQYEYFMKTKQMRFTPPVQTFYALKQAINELKEEGIENRYKRYSKSWDTLTKGLKKLGLKYLVDDENHSRIITSIILPEGIEFELLHDYFYRKGFTIYPGKVEKFNTFRIANIGDIDYTNINLFLSLLEEYLNVIQ